MKYGKEFQQLLEGSDFPDDWKSSAIEYRQLKKIIKDVVAELSSMGLSPDILQTLLVTQDAGAAAGHDVVAPAKNNEELVEVQSQDDAQDLKISAGPRIFKRAIDDGHGGLEAEYVLTGEPSRPIPQLRLRLYPLPHSHPSPPESSLDSELETETEPEDEPDGQLLTRIAATPRPLGHQSPLLPSSPVMERVRGAKSPIWAMATSCPLSEEFGELSLGDAAYELQPLPTAVDSLPPHHPSPLEIQDSTETKEFIIPLSSDFVFFSLLTTALTSLSAFHAKQQTLFHQSVEHLCGMISTSISPSETKIRPASGAHEPRLETQYPSSRRTSKKDLYAWREIFTLWIEAQIFESTSERDRGERTIAQAEARLQSFASHVVNRGLGDRRTMRGKKVKEAWEEFLRLNMLLLELKKFQTANIQAARKILKKHDKRTALTATTNFQSFVRQTLSAHVDKDGNISTWIFYNTSLPHVLLASLTTTLLPIIPSLDDYACLICTSIAFKPIRLACGHLFCVRCLVKMQKAGKGECPLCRADVVLLADKSCLDLPIMQFMKVWFPKEVKDKRKENQVEVTKEQIDESGLDQRCVVM